MRFIAITGGMGCGKSTVLNLFTQLGAATWDADLAVHDLYRPGQPGWCELRKQWGDEPLREDGQLNRAWLAERLFRDPREREAWEAIIHPLVYDHMQNAAATAAPPLLCAIPLLYESGWESRFDAVACVWCPPSIQRERLRQRGMSDADIDARLATQLPPDEKLRRAEFAIINSGDLELLNQQCAPLWQRWKTPPASPSPR